MASIEKDLFSFKYPEFKVSTCVTGWTNIPCGTLLHPKWCKQEIKAPCTQTKTSQFRVYVLVTYPDTVEEVVKREINRCHNIAVGVATAVIVKAATASSVVGPQATIAAAIGAIGPAAKAYGESFYACLAATSIPTVIRNQIKANLYHEDKGITGWAYHDIYSQYNHHLVHGWYGNEGIYPYYL